MRYIVALVISLPIFVLPTVGNKSISLGIAFIIFAYFWVGIAIGEEIGKKSLKN